MRKGHCTDNKMKEHQEKRKIWKRNTEKKQIKGSKRIVEQRRGKKGKNERELNNQKGQRYNERKMKDQKNIKRVRKSK